MSDIATTWSIDHGDWSVAGADLASGDDLATAVLISLFTDAQAASDDPITAGANDPRGWWGDLGATRPIGSKLWLRLGKRTGDTLAKVRGDIVAALQWLIDDGVAARIEVTTQFLASDQLGAQIVVSQSDGPRRALNYAWAWAGA